MYQFALAARGGNGRGAMPFLMSFALEHEIVTFACIDNASVQFPLNIYATKGLTLDHSRSAVRPAGQKPRLNSVNPRGGGRYGSSTTPSQSAPVLETENGLNVCSGSSLLNRATNGPLKTNRFPTILLGAFSEKTSLASLSGEAADSRSVSLLSTIVSCPV